MGGNRASILATNGPRQSSKSSWIQQVVIAGRVGRQNVSRLDFPSSMVHQRAMPQHPQGTQQVLRLCFHSVFCASLHQHGELILIITKTSKTLRAGMITFHEESTSVYNTVGFKGVTDFHINWMLRQTDLSRPQRQRDHLPAPQ